jgi:hypothetical protein
MLNQESIEDLDDSKKKPALDVTFKPDSSPSMKLQKLIETQLKPAVPKDQQVAALESQLKL